MLMLRGAQTPGELKQRTERMQGFADMAELQDVLTALIDKRARRRARAAPRAEGGALPAPALRGPRRRRARGDRRRGRGRAGRGGPAAAAARRADGSAGGRGRGAARGSRRAAGRARRMRADATFTVESFTPAALEPAPPEVTTALPLGVATIEKRFSGEVTGRSVTIFVAAFDQARGVGSYVAMESFEGARVAPRARSTSSIPLRRRARIDPTSTSSSSRPAERVRSRRSRVGRAVDRRRGTHRVWFDYSL